MSYTERIAKAAITAAFIFFITGNLFADGFIVVPEPPPNIRTSAFPLEVKYHRVNVEISEQSAVTYIDQEFYNPTRARLEGYYIFPIPEGAVIKKFSMYINGTETQAELLNAQKARRIYEDIVRKSLDPALLEYTDRGIFRARIFPIEPGSTKRVKISYSQLLEKDNKTVEYVYPLNTEKFSAKLLKDVSVNIDIKTKGILRNIFSTTHEAEYIRKDDHHAKVSWQAANVKPDIDFILYYNTDDSGIGMSLLTYRKDKTGHFFLSLSPGFTSGNEISEKDITFVLDTSGSMKGEKLEQAKKALTYCVDNLNRNDRFQIVRFSTEAEKLFTSLSKADKASLQEAQAFINDLTATGGTNIEEALSLALPGKPDASRSHMIIFITDGKPTVGETDENKLLKKIVKANKSNARIFTFGIGYEINTHLLDRITLETKAFRNYITPGESIDKKISGFYNKVQSPVLTSLKLTFDNIRTSRTYPKELPDLFGDSSLVVLGEYSGHGKSKIVLEGTVNGKNRIFEYTAEFPEKDTGNDYIPTLWAARHVGYLLDQVRLNGEDRELIDEITETARKYGIVTPYTSYLILEDEMERLSGGAIRADDMTLGNVAPQIKGFAARSESEYRDMKSKSGESGVLPSRELQAMNKASSLSGAIQGHDRLDYKDAAGAVQNIADNVKNVSGRAFYNAGRFWVDSLIQSGEKQYTLTRIRFAGKAYFDLLKRNSEAAQVMALGRNVRFLLNGDVYEIYE